MMPYQHDFGGAAMTDQDFSRRSFLTKGAAAGVGAAALATAATEADAQTINWDQTADVVIIGAGVAGLPAAITARELGASVIIVEENYDIGGRGMLSGGRVAPGGGPPPQQKVNNKGDPGPGVPHRGGARRPRGPH